MDNLYILDTDHLSLFQNGNPIIAKRMSRKQPESLAVTVITLEEKIKGWFREINKYNNEPFKPKSKLVWAYKGLADEIDFCKSIRLLAFDKNAYETYRSLVVIDKVKGIGARDLRIAAITLSLKGILVTRNWRDFEKVPNLLLEDWTIS